MARPDITGYVLCDMHDYRGRLSFVVENIEWVVIVDSWQTLQTSRGTEIIEGYIDRPYTNKYLVVIEDLGDDKIRAAYSYDGLRFGVMTLRAFGR
jgi:hypothetical protein